MSARILIIDDETALARFFAKKLTAAGYQALTAATAGQGEQLIKRQEIDLVLLDQQLPDANGLDVLQGIREQEPELPVIMVTAHGGVGSAVRAMRNGAYDYLQKPVDLDYMVHSVSKALEAYSMRREIRRLRSRSQVGYAQTWIVGNTARMKSVAEMVARVAASSTTVLLQGESGTGKDVIANAIHQQSSRALAQFIPINCAAIPDALLESELFGYESGAFTGARKQKRGMIEVADGGTLFLDEISGMKPEMQIKLLRVLETREVRRVGGISDSKVDIRVLAATNRNLSAAIERGEFRDDLFYRLSVVTIDLPPLRERKEDINLFVAAFVDQLNRSTGRCVTGVSSEALQVLHEYHWPGNIRELRNILERAIILCDGDEIRPEHLPREMVSRAAQHVPSADLPVAMQGLDLKVAVSQVEEHLIRKAMEASENNQSKAAAMLGVSRDELRHRLHKYNLP